MTPPIQEYAKTAAVETQGGRQPTPSSGQTMQQNFGVQNFPAQNGAQSFGAQNFGAQNFNGQTFGAQNFAAQNGAQNFGHAQGFPQQMYGGMPNFMPPNGDQPGNFLLPDFPN